MDTAGRSRWLVAAIAVMVLHFGAALGDPLEREIAYTLLAWASGYGRLYVDDLLIIMEDPDPLEITLDLERRDQ